MKSAALLALCWAGVALAEAQDVSTWREGTQGDCAKAPGFSAQLADGKVVAEAAPQGPRVDALPFKVTWQQFPDDAPGSRLVHPVEDGFIVGYNAAEQGGGIWWFSPNGEQRRFIAKEHPVTFLQRGVEVLALVGATLEGRSSGRLLRMYRLPDGTWRWQRVAEVSRTPRTGLLEPDGSVLVLTDASVLRISPSGEKSSLHAGPWRSLSPSSMVRAPDGALFIGAKGGVIELRQAGAGALKETFRAAPCESTPASAPPSPPAAAPLDAP